MSGEGADELFAGYGRIFRSPHDFLMGKKLYKELNCTELPDPTTLVFARKTILFTHGDLLCFELFMYSLIGPSFYEWGLSDTDCYNYFAGLLGRTRKSITIPENTSDEYNDYLSEIGRWNSDKHLEQLKLDDSSLENIHITTFTQIDNPQEATQPSPIVLIGIFDPFIMSINAKHEETSPPGLEIINCKNGFFFACKFSSRIFCCEG